MFPSLEIYHSYEYLESQHEKVTDGAHGMFQKHVAPSAGVVDLTGIVVGGFNRDGSWL